jgi:hypothetical protein
VGRLVDALLDQAITDKSLAAAELLLRFTAGPPIAQEVHPDRLDEDELWKLRNQPSIIDGEVPCMHRVPAAVKVLVERVSQFNRGLEELGATVAFDGDKWPGFRADLLGTVRAWCGELLSQVQSVADKLLARDREFEARQANQEQSDGTPSQEG